MKRLIGLFLLVLLFFSACGGDDEIRFYYPKAEFDYRAESGIMESEVREAPGHEDDLNYLMAVYFEGPVDQELTSPFPRGTAMLEYSLSGNTLEMTMNESFAALDDLEHTIASACIAQTCFGLTDAEHIVIKYNSDRYGSKTINLSRDSLVMTDNAVDPSQTIEP